MEAIHFCVEIITCDPSVYTMDHPGLLHQTKMNPLGHKGLKIYPSTTTANWQNLFH